MPTAFEAVLDTSVVLAVIREERGSAQARARIPKGAISVVNLAEVVTKLIEWGVPEAIVKSSLADLNLVVLGFDEHLAVQAGLLHRWTRGHNISLGDRACLVTARHFGVPAVTGDHSWRDLDVDVSVELIR